MPHGQITGVGDYWTDARDGIGRALDAVRRITPNGTFAKLGRAVGGAFGHPVLGASAGKLMSQIVGFGDYSIQSNSLMKLDMGQLPPHFGNVSQGIIIAHREYLGDLVSTGSTAFNNVEYAMNPGMPGTFPYLAAIANQFDQYQLVGCIVEFRSTSSDYATGTALGSVIIASEYDPADAPYGSKVAMENSQYCTSSKPSESFIHPIECDPSVNLTPRLFTRSGSVPYGKDIRLYDHCTLNVATVGNSSAAGTVLGELWINYHIALYKPQLGVQQSFDHVILNAAGVSASNYFGTDPTTAPSSRSTLGGTVDVATGSGRYYFPSQIQRGNFQVTYTVVGASTVLGASAVIGLGFGVSSLNLLNENGSSSIVIDGGNTGQTITATKFVTVTSRGAYIIMTGGLPTGVLYGDVFVNQLPDVVN